MLLISYKLLQNEMFSFCALFGKWDILVLLLLDVQLQLTNYRVISSGVTYATDCCLKVANVWPNIASYLMKNASSYKIMRLRLLLLAVSLTFTVMYHCGTWPVCALFSAVWYLDTSIWFVFSKWYALFLPITVNPL